MARNYSANAGAQQSRKSHGDQQHSCTMKNKITKIPKIENYFFFNIHTYFSQKAWLSCNLVKQARRSAPACSVTRHSVTRHRGASAFLAKIHMLESGSPEMSSIVSCWVCGEVGQSTAVHDVTSLMGTVLSHAMEGRHSPQQLINMLKQFKYHQAAQTCNRVLVTEEQKVQHAKKMAGSKHVSLQLDELLQNFSLAGLETSFESPEKLCPREETPS